MMSLLCGLARYGLNYNHWVDVAVGFGIGVVLAVYIVSLMSLLLVPLSLCISDETNDMKDGEFTASLNQDSSLSFIGCNRYSLIAVIPNNIGVFMGT
jgi:hypothetical protein